MFRCPVALQRREGEIAVEISAMDPVDTLVAQCTLLQNKFFCG
jgi:hypothetical protein